MHLLPPPSFLIPFNPKNPDTDGEMVLASGPKPNPPIPASALPCNFALNDHPRFKRHQELLFA